MLNPFATAIDWLVTHLVALIFSLFILVAYIARGPLFGMLEPVQSAEVAPAIAVEQQTSEGNTDFVTEKQPPAADSAAAAEPLLVPQAAPSVSAKPDAVIINANESTRQEDATFRPTEPDEADHQQFVPMTLVDEPLPEVQLQDPQPPLSMPLRAADIPAEPPALLQQARAAFWNGNMQEAERLYLRHLTLEPTDAESFGELGNLYQSMGRSIDALDAYFEAGIRFQAQQDRGQLEQIIRLLGEAGDPRVQQLLP